MKVARLRVLNKAVEQWTWFGDMEGYTFRDALTVALEYFDTGYELTKEEYEKLLADIEYLAGAEIE